MRGDLFSCPDSESLAHCISADARMGKGIAVLFKNKFSGVDNIKSQGNTQQSRKTCVNFDIQGRVYSKTQHIRTWIFSFALNRFLYVNGT